MVEGRWLAFDREVPRELHWNLCPKNPEAAKDLIKRVIELQAEVDRVKERNKALEADVRVREVELRRLTRKVEKVEQPS